MSTDGAAAGRGGEPGDEAAGIADGAAFTHRVPQEEGQQPPAQLQEPLAPLDPLERYLERGASQRSRGIEAALSNNKSLSAVITTSEIAHVFYLLLSFVVCAMSRRTVQETLAIVSLRVVCIPNFSFSIRISLNSPLFYK